MLTTKMRYISSNYYVIFLPFTDKLLLSFLKTFLAWNVFVRFAPLNSCPAESLCFHSISRCNWFVASSHDFYENKQLDHQSTIIFISLGDFFHSYFIKVIDHSFYGFTGGINNLGCWERLEKHVNHSPNGSWFTSFSRVLPTSHVVYCAGKPIGKVVYCLIIL